eukprot:CAMPEP_0115309188 /NCGR_PEP_ID=MMETSP0270-20121206/74113_1 /TAXON_ID=71861 /ORGANISM="Scrippsiella trochoidea, Strain CCMP3099" /LENGTH=47 /DNA_ID= /DNA_START= /DNA_END= /DNA_ORIENTATION=
MKAMAVAGIAGASAHHPRATATPMEPTNRDCQLLQASTVFFHLAEES